MGTTRLVIQGAANTGGSRATVDPATDSIAFETPLRGTYAPGDFIVNISLNAAKEITGIVKLGAIWHDEMILSVSVADVTGWLSTHTYALMLTNAPSEIYNSLTGGLSASVSDVGDEVVVYPSDEKTRTGLFHPFTGFAPPARTDVTVRGYSTLKKVILHTDGLVMSNAGDHAYTWEDFRVFGGESRSVFDHSNVGSLFTNIFKRMIISSVSKDNARPCIKSNVGASGSTIRVINSVFHATQDGIEIRDPDFIWTVDHCGFIGCLAGLQLVSSGPVCLVRNSYGLWCGTVFLPSAGTFIATSTNNAASDGTAPGVNVVSNDFDSSDIAMAMQLSPGLTGAGFPFDFRDIDNEGSLLKDAGIFLADVTDDIDGRLRSVTTPDVGPTEGFMGFGIDGVPRTRPATAIFRTRP